ncbi:MAG: hypothetical protein K5639_04505 [Eubacterium sp.]|nr:hypothetical protein [Eubacterium sp.]
MKTSKLTKGILMLTVIGTLAGGVSGIGTPAKAAKSKSLGNIQVEAESKLPKAIDCVDDMQMSIIDKKSKKMAINSHASANTDEYSSEIANYIENSLDAQMSAYLNGSSGTKAKVLSKDEIDSIISSGTTYYSFAGINYKSGVEFTLDTSKVDLSNISGEYMAYYCWDAIANKPNLCTLSIYSSAVIRNGKNYRIIFPSTIKEDEHVKYIKMYKNFLAYIERKVDEDTTMSDMDILIYYYDTVMQATKYATSEVNRPDSIKDWTVHMPVGIVKRSDIVCQCYAVVLNQLLRHSGFVTYNVFGHIDTGSSRGGHAWNIIKLGNNWYYLDSTWDDSDSFSSDRSLVKHDFFLFNMNVRNYVREMYDFYIEKFAGIKAKSDDAYNTHFTKSNVIKNGLYYANGSWYFVTSGNVCKINEDRTKYMVVEDIPYDPVRFVTALGNTLYYGGTDGVYAYNPATGATETISEKAYRYGYVRKNKMLARKDEDCKWYHIEDTSWSEDADTDDKTPAPTPKPEPTPAPNPDKTPTPTPDTSATNNMAIPTLKVKAIKGKKISIKVKSKSSNGIQIEMSDDETFDGSDDRSFSSNKKSGEWVVKGLKKGYSYFVRVRAYVKKSGKKTYSNWSVVKSVKVKNR